MLEKFKKPQAIKMLMLGLIGIWLTTFLYDTLTLLTIPFGLVFGVFSIINFIVVTFKNLKSFRKSNEINEFLPTFIGLTSLLFVFLTLAIEIWRDRIPTVFCGYNPGGMGSSEIVFRSNGTFISTFNWIGYERERGNYLKKDSIINLTKTKYLTEKLIIKNDTIFQVDDSGKILDIILKFEIRKEKVFTQD